LAKQMWIPERIVLLNHSNEMFFFLKNRILHLLNLIPK
jgi:hypothetical protein